MNYVSLVGRIKERRDDGIRFLEVNRPESVDSADNLLIPCRYWTMDNSNLLSSLKEGQLVAIRGRIDIDNTLGVYVIIEQVVIIK